LIEYETKVGNTFPTPVGEPVGQPLNDLAMAMQRIEALEADVQRRDKAYEELKLQLVGTNAQRDAISAFAILIEQRSIEVYRLREMLISLHRDLPVANALLKELNTRIDTVLAAR
jgi:hypothetical protein